MRRLMALVLGVGLVGCASSPTPGTAKAGDRRGPSVRALDIPALGAGIFHCSGPGAAAQHPNYLKCIEIPVVVLDTGSGCASLLPYNELQVHVGPNKPSTDIVWNLVGPKGYTFDVNDGISFLNPGTTYVRVGPSAGDTKYRWRVESGATPGYVGHHQALVRSSSGTPCTPIDPRAINTDQ